MMMRHFRSLPGALLAALALLSLPLTSCEDVIDLDLPQRPPLLAVEGAITDQPGPYVVKLALTAPYFREGPLPPVTGAVLTLAEDGAGGSTETLRERSPGEYVTSQLRGQIGRQYTLTIQTEGQTYRAQTEIRRTMAIDSLGQKYIDVTRGPDSVGYQVQFYARELPGPGDSYRYKVYRNGLLWDQPADLLVVTDDLLDGRYLAGPLDGHSYQPGQRVRVEINSITDDYKLFLQQVATQTNNRGLFAPPPANARTNVRNLEAGSARVAVGYFAGYTVRADSITIRE